MHHYYCNLGLPIAGQHDVYQFVDLDLDLLVYPGGRHAILDEDEFAAHQERFGYPADVIAGVRRAAQDVLALAQSHRDPFDGTLVASGYRRSRQRWAATRKRCASSSIDLGLAALPRGSSRPHQPPSRAFPGEHAEQLRALVHRRPRDGGYATSLWTLDLAAEVSFVQGLTPRLVTGEAIRMTLLRLGIGGKRAKQWITSPDPAYVRKKADATA